jgi:hypothetical protein
MLPSWLLPFLRRLKQHRINRAVRNPTPKTDPITMPAMAPPDKPLLSGSATGLLVGDEVGEAVEVAKVMVGVMEGRTTPTHRFLTSEL